MVLEYVASVHALAKNPLQSLSDRTLGMKSTCGEKGPVLCRLICSRTLSQDIWSANLMKDTWLLLDLGG